MTGTLEEISESAGEQQQSKAPKGLTVSMCQCEKDSDTGSMKLTLN